MINQSLNINILNSEYLYSEQYFTIFSKSIYHKSGNRTSKFAKIGHFFEVRLYSNYEFYQVAT